MIAGMPILRRTQSVKAVDLNPALAHETLSLAFGKSMFTAYEEMFERLETRNAAEAEAQAVSVSMADFQSRFLRKPEDDQPNTVPADNGFDDGFGASSERDLVIRRAVGNQLRLFVFDRDHDEEVSISPSQLIPGEYARETENGTHEGYTIVNEQGRMVHFDIDRQRTHLAVVAREETPDQAPSRRLH
jgi:hypothetical protein